MISRKFYAFRKWVKPYLPVWCKILFHACYNIYSKILFGVVLYRTRKSHRAILRKIKNKDTPIKIAFYVFFDSIWKCDELYRLLLNDPRYDPFVVLCPVVNFGDENMITQMEKCVQYFTSKGYSFVRGYENNSFIDIEEVYKPDLIIYTNPYSDLTNEKFRIENVKNALTCYIPYFYLGSNYQIFFNLNFHKMLWAHFVESSYHIQFFKKVGKDIKNCIPVGYTVFDEFDRIMSNSVISTDSPNRFTILWSPHHTINDNELLCQSGFIELADFFIEFQQRNQETIRIIFRPHPILKSKLYTHPDWGKNKTDQYYQYWDNPRHGKLSDGGNYIYDFIESDMIVHDCGSFISEYMYTLKPAIYFSKEEKYYAQLNFIGKEAFNSHYIVKTKDEIEIIINRIIWNGEDPQFESRKSYKKKFLKFSDKSPTMEIYQYLNKQLF